MNDSYKVQMTCSNCGQQVRMAFTRGKTVPDFGIKCPTCGCMTLYKDGAGPRSIWDWFEGLLPHD